MLPWMDVSDTRLEFVPEVQLGVAHTLKPGATAVDATEENGRGRPAHLR